MRSPNENLAHSQLLSKSLEHSLDISLDRKAKATISSLAQCQSCQQLKRELHELRLKNIAIRDDCNKLRQLNQLANEGIAKLRAENQQ